MGRILHLYRQAGPRVEVAVIGAHGHRRLIYYGCLPLHALWAGVV
jgi:hypothetical protein